MAEDNTMMANACQMPISVMADNKTSGGWRQYQRWLNISDTG
jgi:hypothetical protein